MKRIVLVFIFVVVSFTSYAQEVKNNTEKADPRGYIGLLFGFSRPTFSLYEMTGEKERVPINGSYFSVKFGYLFTKNIGLSLAYANTSNESKYTEKQNNYTFMSNYLLLGIILRFKLINKLYLDFNPAIGYSFVDATVFMQKKSESFSYDIGAGLRYEIFPRIDLMLNADILSYNSKYITGISSFDFNEQKGEQQITLPTISLGVSYKLW